MTAPDARALLDELEKLRGEATAGPWATDERRPADVVNRKGHPIVYATATLDRDADAALIVAAVNRLPALTAALRGALDLADELEREAFGDGKGTIHAAGALYANRLRTTVAAALTAERTTP